MTSKIRISVVLLALAAACATGGGGKGGRSERFYQATYKLPAESQLDDAERGKIRDSRTHYERGLVAQQSGNVDQAVPSHRASPFTGIPSISRVLPPTKSAPCHSAKQLT